jgi:hypothetical protein
MPPKLSEIENSGRGAFAARRNIAPRSIDNISADCRRRGNSRTPGRRVRRLGARKPPRRSARKSPTSLKIAFRELREGKTLSFDDCMRMEFRIASRILAGHDFFEGVRAVLVEKDNAPRWRPAALGEVTDEVCGGVFRALGKRRTAPCNGVGNYAR